MVSKESDRYRIAAYYFYKNPLTVFLYFTRRTLRDTLILTIIELQSFVEMILTLKDIATVSSIVTCRSRIEASKDGNVRVIQMKGLGDDNFVHLIESNYSIYGMELNYRLIQNGT